MKKQAIKKFIMGKVQKNIGIGPINTVTNWLVWFNIVAS